MQSFHSIVGGVALLLLGSLLELRSSQLIDKYSPARYNPIPTAQRRISLRAKPWFMGIQDTVACEWTTDHALVNPLIHSNNPDLIQQKAAAEGICPSPSLQLHIFSTNQARQCLQPLTILGGGDSYNRQLFVGLGDILLGRPSNEEIQNGTHRVEVLNETIRLMENEHTSNPTGFPLVTWPCHEECYGEMKPFWQTCSRCIKRAINKVSNDTTPIPVLGTMVHVYNHLDRDVKATVKELTHLWQNTPNLIYQSQPNYMMERVPGQFKSDTRGRSKVFDALIPTIQHNPSTTFMDFVELTKTCRWTNCSADGGHRSRFVNRWKAQLLLNTLCEYI